MLIDERTIEKLKQQVKGYMDEGRYLHSLSVERECALIGVISKLPDEEVSALRVSALLHDITRRLKTDEHIELLEKSNIKYDSEWTLTPSILHQYTAQAIIKRDFPKFYTEKIISPILSHTTGKPDMSVTEKILYIADVIEPKRKHKLCQKTREYYYTHLDEKDIIDSTLTLCLAGSISHLAKSRKPIAHQTIDAYNYYTKDGKNN